MITADKSLKFNPIFYQPWFQASFAAGLLLVLFVLVNLSLHNWDAMVFTFRGTALQQSMPGGSIGYDGQYVYWIISEPIKDIHRIPEAVYRYQRILYPLLGWVLSLGGQLPLIPWAMMLINLAAGLICCVTLSELLRRRMANPWLALVFAGFGGSLFVLLMDLNELLAMALALVAIKSLEDHQLLVSAVFFALGGLAKDLALVIMAGCALWLWLGGNRQKTIKLVLISLIPYVVWAIFLHFWIGTNMFNTAATHIEFLPFSGFFYADLKVDDPTLIPLVLLPTLMLGICAAADLIRKRYSLEACLVIVNVVLIAFMPRFSLSDIVAALRIEMGLVATGLLYLVVFRRKLLPWLAALWSLSSILPVALMILFGRIG